MKLPQFVVAEVSAHNLIHVSAQQIMLAPFAKLHSALESLVTILHLYAQVMAHARKQILVYVRMGGLDQAVQFHLASIFWQTQHKYAMVLVLAHNQILVYVMPIGKVSSVLFLNALEYLQIVL